MWSVASWRYLPSGVTNYRLSRQSTVQNCSHRRSSIRTVRNVRTEYSRRRHRQLIRGINMNTTSPSLTPFTSTRASSHRTLQPFWRQLDGTSNVGLYEYDIRVWYARSRRHVNQKESAFSQERFAFIFSVRQHMLIVLCAIARPSVRPSHGCIVRIMKISPYGSAIPLVFAGCFIEQWRQTRVGWEKLAIFVNISKTVPDRPKLLWMTNRKSHVSFRLTQRSMTLDGQICCNFAWFRDVRRQQQLKEWS